MNFDIINHIVNILDPEKIVLFGSRAIGNANKNSDYDLLILKKGVENKRKISQQLYKDLLPFRVAVDIIVDTPENYEVHKREKSFIYYQIDKTGQVIYEKNKKRTDLA